MTVGPIKGVDGALHSFQEIIIIKDQLNQNVTSNYTINNFSMRSEFGMAVSCDISQPKINSIYFRKSNICCINHKKYLCPHTS